MEACGLAEDTMGRIATLKVASNSVRRTEVTKTAVAEPTTAASTDLTVTVSPEPATESAEPTTTAVPAESTNASPELKSDTSKAIAIPRRRPDPPTEAVEGTEPSKSQPETSKDNGNGVPSLGVKDAPPTKKSKVAEGAKAAAVAKNAISAGMIELAPKAIAPALHKIIADPTAVFPMLNQPDGVNIQTAKDKGKKKAHSEVERKRREKINAKIQALQDCVPEYIVTKTGSNSKTYKNHKANILENTLHYISDLEFELYKFDPSIRLKIHEMARDTVTAELSVASATASTAAPAAETTSAAATSEAAMSAVATPAELTSATTASVEAAAEVTVETTVEATATAAATIPAAATDNTGSPPSMEASKTESQADVDMTPN